MAAQSDLNVDAREVENFLREDLGTGDLTAALIPEDRSASATVVAREALVMCGQAWFSEVFSLLDPGSQVEWKVDEGRAVVADTVLCSVNGNARALLTGERTALNLIQTLCSTATLSRRYYQAVEGTGATVLDTRKTIPGLRTAQKYAVRCGGCSNHRTGLYDAVLIKENHIATLGSVAAAVKAAYAKYPDTSIEIEVESLSQLEQALGAGAQRILLDNFSLRMLEQAVSMTATRAKLEASGNISLENIRDYANTGVDFISVGALTKNIQAVDLSMNISVN